MKTLVVVAMLLLCGTLTRDIAAEADAGIRVLLVTGIDYPGHKWRETTPVLKEILEEAAGVQVDVLEDPYRLGSTDLSGYDLFVMHFMNWEKPSPDDRARENLRHFVANGGGLVLIHFACGAFQDWPEFPALAGRVYDRIHTHDPRGLFQVQIVDREHPISDGLASFTADDELYICLTGEKPVRTLATARSKVTGRDHPMAFIHTYGKGRVFHTPLGHDVRALRGRGESELIRRGSLWAAGQPVRKPSSRGDTHSR